MEFTKDLIRYVINERISYNQSVKQAQQFSNSNGNNNHNNFAYVVDSENEVEVAINEIDCHLSKGLSIVVHILLSHTNCNAKQPTNCKAAYTIESWTLQIVPNVAEESNEKPQMIPMFLKQAIRSQLYFSPTKSWFSGIANKKANGQSLNGFQCIYKISPLQLLEKDCNDEFCAKIDKHTFPHCKLDGRTMLNVHVKWLKKEYFPTQVPMCPYKRIDNNSLQYADGELSSKVLEPNFPNFVHNIKKSLSRQNSNNNLNNNSNNGENAKKQQSVYQLNNIKQTTKAKSKNKNKPQKGTLTLSRNRIYPILREPRTINEDLKILHAPMPTNQPQQRPTVVRLIPQLEKNFEIDLTKHGTKNDLRQIENNTNNASICCKKNNFALADVMNYGLPPLNNSTSVRCKSIKPKQIIGLREKIIKSLASEGKLFSNASSFRTNNRKSMRLLCNFEESALRGCLCPVHSADGFKLQIAVTGDSFSTPHIIAPVTTFYFNEDMPSLYMGYCNLSNIVDQSKMGIQIRKQCILQAVLLNPQGSVVKIFLVNIDVNDMPPLTQTFIRQRTTSTLTPILPTSTNIHSKIIPTDVVEKSILSSSPQLLKSGTGNNNAPCVEKIGVTSPTGSRKSHFGGVGGFVLPIKETLKFLINLRLVSDHRGRVFLHSDIKMLLSNKGSDLEGLVSSQTQLKTQMPQQPKYSSI